MNDTIICTYPVYRNKWKFYASYVIKDKSLFNFNWFSCGCPVYDKNNNKIIKVSRYNRFFDVTTGISYYAKYDDLEEKQCELIMIDNIGDTRMIDDYCGFAFEKDESNIYKRDLIDENVSLCFKKSTLKESKSCPYIEYAQSHEDYLRKKIPNFPSSKTLKNAKPGELSLKLRNKLMLFFSN